MKGNGWNTKIKPENTLTNLYHFERCEIRMKTCVVATEREQLPVLDLL